MAALLVEQGLAHGCARHRAEIALELPHARSACEPDQGRFGLRRSESCDQPHLAPRQVPRDQHGLETRQRTERPIDAREFLELARRGAEPLAGVVAEARIPERLVSTPVDEPPRERREDAAEPAARAPELLELSLGRLDSAAHHRTCTYRRSQLLHRGDSAYQS